MSCCTMVLCFYKHLTFEKIQIGNQILSSDTLKAGVNSCAPEVLGVPALHCDTRRNKYHEC